MLRQGLICIFCMVMIPLGLLFGSEGTDGHGGDGGEPDIFSGNLGTAVFTIAIFIVLLIVLGKWAWGPILSGLQSREEYICESIKKAEDARSDAEQALSEYKEQLIRAREEAKEIIDKGRSDAVSLAQELKQSAEEESQSLRSQAERDISSAKEQALKEIYKESTELAAEMAGKIISKSLSAADHRELLQESLDKLQQD